MLCRLCSWAELSSVHWVVSSTWLRRKPLQKCILPPVKACTSATTTTVPSSPNLSLSFSACQKSLLIFTSSAKCNTYLASQNGLVLSPGKGFWRVKSSLSLKKNRLFNNLWVKLKLKVLNQHLIHHNFFLTNFANCSFHKLPISFSWETNQVTSNLDCQTWPFHQRPSQSLSLSLSPPSEKLQKMMDWPLRMIV